MLHGWERLTEDEKAVIERGVADGSVYGGPFHAELSPTDNCNYDCFFCNQAFVDRSKVLSIDHLKSLIDELAGMGLKVMRLSGGGEPLLHPNIKELLEHLKQSRITLDNLTTHGLLLLPPIVERLMALPTREIIVSLNESDPKRYGEMMQVRSDFFGRVVENMKRIVATRRELGRTDPKLVAQFFVWKGNFRDLDRMVALAEEIGVDAISLRSIYGLPAGQRMTEEEREELRELTAPHAERKSKDYLAIDFSFENLFLPGRQDRPIGERKPPCQQGRDKYCYIGWYSTTIRGNGAVYPCCMLQQLPDYPVLGNVNESSFREIWHGEAYRVLRKELRAIAIQRGEIREPDKLVQTKPFCVAEDECPLLFAMCDEGFYQRMNARLERERRSLKERLARVMARSL